MQKMIKKILSTVAITALIWSNIAMNFSVYADNAIHGLDLSEYKGIDIMTPLSVDFKNTEVDSDLLRHWNGKIRHREYYGNYDDEWYDRNWYDNEWYDRNWYDNEWYDRDWLDDDWYDRNWYDDEWYDRNWYDDDWYDRDWLDDDWYDRNWYDDEWYDSDWYDDEWYDRDWLDDNWYDRNWYNYKGYNRNWNYKRECDKRRHHSWTGSYTGTWSDEDTWTWSEENTWTGSNTGTWTDTGTWSDTGTWTDTGTDSNTWTGSNTGTWTNTGTWSDTNSWEIVKQFWRIDWFKFNDENNGTYWDVTEPGINGWVITLKSNSATGTSFTWVTYDNWYFNFSAVPAWSYKLCEVMQTGWTQTYPINVVADTLDGCFNVEVLADTNLRYYFWNHFSNTNTWGETGTWTDTGTGTNTGTGSDTGTGTQTGTWTNTNTWSTSWTGSESGTGTQSGTWSEWNTWNQLFSEKETKNVGTWGGGGWRKSSRLSSFNVNDTVEATWLNSDDLNIVKLYNAYLAMQKKLKTSKNTQEKETIKKYINGDNVTSKYKKQINGLDKRFTKLDKVAKKQVLLKLFNKLELKEAKVWDNQKLKDLLSYMKLQLAISYSKN